MQTATQFTTNNIYPLNSNTLNLNGNIAVNFLNTFKSIHTIKSYTQALKTFFLVKKVEDINLSMIKSIGMLNIQTYIKNLAHKGIATQTIKSRIAALKSFYDYINALDHTIENPFRNNQISKLIKNNTNKNTKQTGIALTEDQITELLNITTLPRDYLILKLLFSTGVRRSELINIKWNDFSWNNEYQRWELTVFGKGRKYRTLQIKQKLIDELIQEFEWKLGEIGTSDKKLFPMTSSNINKIISKYCNKIGIKITPHDCRRTTITILWNNGCPTQEIQYYVGHARITQTEKYVRELENRKNNAGAYVPEF